MTFNYKGWRLSEAMEALIAYDKGTIDSGVHDLAMKQAVADYLKGLDREAFRLAISRHVRRRYLSEKALALQYGIEDALEFLHWLKDELDVGL